MNLSDKPLVSYVIPNYNCGKWLGECLRSVANQTYKPLEIVICDNGSTDESIGILGYFKPPDVKTHVIFEPDIVGHAKAVNLALAKVTGDYIVKLDSDDIHENWHVERLMSLILANPWADIVYGDIETINENGDKISYGKATGCIEDIFDRCCISHNGSLVKKVVYDELGGYDDSEELILSHDWEYLIRMLKGGKQFLYAGMSGHKWRRVASEMSATTINHIHSPGRKKSHSYIRRKFNLSGLCRCGCGAVA